MKTLWNWLNGKKTFFGGLFTATTTFLYAEGIININMSIYLGTVSVLIFGGGIVHKIVKAKAKKNEGAE